jgi:hypothetical protein
MLGRPGGAVPNREGKKDAFAVRVMAHEAERVAHVFKRVKARGQCDTVFDKSAKIRLFDTQAPPHDCSHDPLASSKLTTQVVDPDRDPGRKGMASVSTTIRGMSGGASDTASGLGDRDA